MSSLAFNGTTDLINLALGGIGYWGSGGTGGTIAMIVKAASNGSARHAFYAGAGSGTARWGVGKTANDKIRVQMAGNQYEAPTIGLASSDGWCLVVFKKAAGSTQIGSYSRYRFSDGTWLRESHGAAQGGDAAPTGSLLISGNAANTTERWSGNILIVGWWSATLLTNTQEETLKNGTAAWTSLNPTELWRLNSMDPIQSPGTADETSRTGTTLSSDVPTGWTEPGGEPAPAQPEPEPTPTSSEYPATTWTNNTTTGPFMNQQNLGKLRDELAAQAGARGISHSLPVWKDGQAPALTDSAPWNEMERVAEAVAVSLGSSYEKTLWKNQWDPARAATQLNKLEQRAKANRLLVNAGGYLVGTAQRPYTIDSPWNTPIVGNPYVISVWNDTLGFITNQKWNEGYKGQLSGTTEVSSPDTHFLTSDPTQYTYPVYFTTDADPLINIYFSGTWRKASQPEAMDPWPGSGSVQQLRIPATAQAAAGTDGQIIVINRSTGEEIGIWQLRACTHGTHAFDATNGASYNVQWPAVMPPNWPSRGAGVTYQSGLIRPWEIQQGKIEHALSYVLEEPSVPFLFPAMKSDGGRFGTLSPMFLRVDASDLTTSGALFNRSLGRGHAAPSSFQTTISAGQTQLGYMWSRPDYWVPRSGRYDTINGNGNYTLDLNVTNGSADITVSFAISRTDAAGVVQTTSAYSSGVAMTTGQKRLSLNTAAVGTFNSSATSPDRLRLIIRLVSASTGATVTVATGSVRSMLTTPWGAYMPEGSRVQLDPSISEATIAAWTDPYTNAQISSTGVIIAKALQEYGMYIIDVGGSKKVTVEYQDTANWGSGGTPALVRNTVRAIPMNHMRWVEPPPNTMAPWWVADTRF